LLKRMGNSKGNLSENYQEYGLGIRPVRAKMVISFQRTPSIENDRMIAAHAQQMIEEDKCLPFRYVWQ